MLPLMVSPSLSRQIGGGMQRLVAAARENSALVRVVWLPGSASTQAEETLSRCLQAQASLVLFGRTLSSTLVSTLDLRLSSDLISLVLVSPETESPPTPSYVGWNGRGSSWPRK